MILSWYHAVYDSVSLGALKNFIDSLCVAQMSSRERRGPSCGSFLRIPWSCWKVFVRVPPKETYDYICFGLPVELWLVPQWCLSAIYTVTLIKSGVAGIGESVSWKVQVHGPPRKAPARVVDWVEYCISLSFTTCFTSFGSATFEPDYKIQAFDPTNASLKFQRPKH